MKANDLIKMVEAEQGKIAHKGMGGFLNPPGHPEHEYRVDYDLHRGPNHGSMSLSAALESDYIDDHTKEQAWNLLDNWEENKLPLTDPQVQDWLRQVMGYFVGMYNVGKGWDADKLDYKPYLDPVESQDQHAGVHFIQGYYPDFKLTQDIVDQAYWGEKKPSEQGK